LRFLEITRPGKETNDTECNFTLSIPRIPIPRPFFGPTLCIFIFGIILRVDSDSLCALFTAQEEGASPKGASRVELARKEVIDWETAQQELFFGFRPRLVFSPRSSELGRIKCEGWVALFLDSLRYTCSACQKRYGAPFMPLGVPTRSFLGVRVWYIAGLVVGGGYMRGAGFFSTTIDLCKGLGREQHTSSPLSYHAVT
jgi:hypothetical protein